MTNKRIKKSAKKLFKTQYLCYPIKEADRFFSGHIPRPASAGTNGRKMPPDDSFNIWWRYITEKELSANLYRNRKIGFFLNMRHEVVVFIVPVGNNNYVMCRRTVDSI